MTRAAATLRALTSGLRGLEPAPSTDWTLVIELANKTWLSPTLYCSLWAARKIDCLPDQARDYLSFIHQRTRERNSRMRTQLLEALSALNRADIEPTVLKGAIGLIAAPDAELGSRLMSDIDMAVSPPELATAVNILTALGYASVDGDRGMARPSDAAMLELRAHPLSPTATGRATSLQPLHMEYGGTRARIPSSTAQALHLVRHDMLKEGDYWRGRIDLRHLHDLARLANTGEVDWACLRSEMARSPDDNALETQLLTLRALFDVGPAQRQPTSMIATLQSWRRLTIAGHPVLGTPLHLAGNIIWGWKRMMAFENLHAISAAELARRAGGILMGTNTGPKI